MGSARHMSASGSARAECSPSGEDGVALVTSLIVMVVCAGLGLAIFLAAHGANDRSRTRNDRILARTAVDSAIDTYLAALNADIAGEHNGFMLDNDAMLAVQNPSKGRYRFANSALPASFGKLRVVGTGTYGIPSTAQYTMREPGPAANTYNYWQLYAIKQPGPSFNTNSGFRVIAYFRGWTANTAGTVITKPRIVRTEMRSGRFGDYQIIADGPVTFLDGARIDGRVHSNGFDDTQFGMGSPPPYIGAAPGNTAINCTSAARFTSTRGSIDAAGLGCPSPAAQKDEGTGTPISMLRVDEAVKRIANHCGSNDWARIVCQVGNADDRGTIEKSDDRYVVTLSGNSVTIAGVGTYTATWKGLVILLDNNVWVSGMVSSDARITIAAWDRNLNDNSGVVGYSGASIYVYGDTGLNSPATQPNDTLGLLAQGDVVLNIDPPGGGSGCRASMSNAKLNAAVVAMSGAITIPPRWKLPTPPPGADAPTCGTLSMMGSFAGHYTPLVHGRLDVCDLDDNGDPVNCSPTFEVGYPVRNYRYDPHLYDNPPPYFPLTGPWQKEAYKDANEDCFDSAGNLSDPYCS